MKYTVRELIRDLEQYDEDVEVRVAFQPEWPLRAKVRNVIASEEFVGYGDEDDPERDGVENYVWIAVDQVSSSGDENPYAPHGAWVDR